MSTPVSTLQNSEKMPENLTEFRKATRHGGLFLEQGGRERE